MTGRQGDLARASVRELAGHSSLPRGSGISTEIARQSRTWRDVESSFSKCSLCRMLPHPDTARALDLGSASEPPSETLEQLVARLSIRIGAQAAASPIIQDRQIILETA